MKEKCVLCGVIESHEKKEKSQYGFMCDACRYWNSCDSRRYNDSRIRKMDLKIHNNYIKKGE